MGRLRGWQQDLQDPGSDLAQRVLREQQAKEARVVDEAFARPMSVMLTCEHARMTVHHAVMGLDRTEVAYGRCLDCGLWVRRDAQWEVSELGLRLLNTEQRTVRPMTDAEKNKLQAYEDRVRDS